MLNKNRLNKKLKRYIKDHLNGGYTRKAVKKVLINYGYNEPYIDGLLKKNSELQFVKKYAILVSLLFIVSFFSFNYFKIGKEPQKITGYVTTISNKDEGCCTSMCQQTAQGECYGKFENNKKCGELDDCNVGCCIDKEGYCLANYLYGNCLEGHGTYVYKECSDLIFCRNLTDKSFTSRIYSIKKNKAAGITVLKNAADYYGSSFNVRYYLYDKTDVLSVSAHLVDNGQLVDTITLFDDGAHNDGSKDDNVYGNNWLSSTIKDFNGFKKLILDIIVRYNDGTEQTIRSTQSIVVLNKNKCLPILGDFENLNNKSSIIFAADNYANLSDGYQKFELDARNFLSAFSSNGESTVASDNFNIYRLEESLSYYNILTLLSVVSNSCPSYSNKKDLIILLDNNEEDCISEGTSVIRVNPQVLFYKNITDALKIDSFSNFCDYVVTPKKLSDIIIMFATPPQITINTLDNITYNTSIINLSYQVSAVNFPLNVSIFLEDVLISNGVVDQSINDSLLLNLTNGTNVIVISGNDKNANFAFSQVLLNVSAE